ncbi:hypothetical protein [Actinoallomurus acaciae]|uniref:Uncharacterized protein n=1 Tax=Actinoallomurus acaciae TaxID=502577 RepID=A0ABV5Y8P7_9ACTN
MTRILQIDERHTRDQFEAGDAALEIEPIQQAGGAYPADELFSVEADMQRLFDDTRIPVGH